MPDDAIKADYLRDFMMVAFSHPSVSGIILWEFWQGLVSGNPDAALIFQKDWLLKPSGRVWKELVFKQWWTDAEGGTDPLGRWQTRGFLGDYDIVVTARDGRTKWTRVVLPAEGRKLIVSLDKGGI